MAKQIMLTLANTPEALGRVLALINRHGGICLTVEARRATGFSQALIEVVGPLETIEAALKKSRHVISIFEVSDVAEGAHHAADTVE